MFEVPLCPILVYQLILLIFFRFLGGLVGKQKHQPQQIFLVVVIETETAVATWQRFCSSLQQQQTQQHAASASAYYSPALTEQVGADVQSVYKTFRDGRPMFVKYSCPTVQFTYVTPPPPPHVPLSSAMTMTKINKQLEQLQCADFGCQHHDNFSVRFGFSCCCTGTGKYQYQNWIITGPSSLFSTLPLPINSTAVQGSLFCSLFVGVVVSLTSSTSVSIAHMQFLTQNKIKN